eukprot:11853980-Heterocapsa_arctica.AAC.1
MGSVLSLRHGAQSWPQDALGRASAPHGGRRAPSAPASLAISLAGVGGRPRDPAEVPHAGKRSS